MRMSAQTSSSKDENHCDVIGIEDQKIDDNKPITKDCAMKLDVQEFLDIHEDDVVDFETAEEFLLHFSRAGQVTLVKKLISLKNSKEICLDIDCKGTSKSNYGWSSLHLASYFGFKEVVDILLKNGANVNIQNEEGDTPLHKAAYTGREDIVILLLSHQANVFIPNGEGLRALELSKNDSILELLLAAERSDIKRKEEQFLSAARCGDMYTIRKLFEDVNNCVDINCVDSMGNSALHNAAYRGQHEVVLFLLKNGIDTSIKNKRGQLAANIANTVSLKQTIQEAHLSIMTPKVVAALKHKSVARFEGILLKKGRFFGWRLVWSVLERGVFSFYNNRADAVSGARRKGYKYLENAITEVLPNNPGDQQLAFMIIFGDRSRAMFSVPKNQTEFDLQKWINAINDHIYFSTNFIKQGTHLNDSDDEDEAAKLLSPLSIQDMICTANAHQKILERHINSLQQLLDDESLFSTGDRNTNGDPDGTLCNDSVHSYNSIDSISKSTIPSIKFHLNLIVESSKNANSSLAQCLTLVSHQNESGQILIRQQQEKVKVLEEALQLLAREHHDLERSVSRTMQRCVGDHSNSMAASISISCNGQNVLLAKKSLSRSMACMSTSSATDIEEYFDAFDDAFDEEYSENDGDNNELLQKDNEQSNLATKVDLIDSTLDLTNNQSIQTDQLNLRLSSSAFHTAQPDQNQDTTINDSLSTLSPDGSDQKTIGSDDLPFSRDCLPARMVPRDEIGLWSILKHCIGKELSKITFPVIFNEPLSLLQRMTEIFQYSHYLNIADQCDDIVERMENICAFIVSAYSSNWLRLNKPFNPLLGETFEYEIASSETRVVFEQVSHHPPISAWHAESPHYVLHGTSAPKLKFWGKSIEVKPEGCITLKLKNKNEIYTWKSVNCCVHNIIVGKLWFEQYGTIEVINRMNDFRMIINFKPAGWFGYDLNRFDGFIQDANKEKLRFVYGKWNDYLKSANINDYEDYLKANNNKFRVPEKPIESGDSTSRKVISKLNSFTKQFTTGSNNIPDPDTPPDNLPPEDGNGDIPKSDSSHSLDISNSRILWKASPRPENSAQYYHFNSFTFGLNELPEDKDALNRLPCTDSRFRPDIRKLEEGDLDAAAAEKNRLEEKQREARRLRKKGKMKEFDALWFRPESNQHTGTEDWLFTHQYWNRDWSKCPDIF